ncbi:MAG: TadE/TadG family type IV pilus assembly protein [Alphaproteobacteria bacterium]
MATDTTGAATVEFAIVGLFLCMVLAAIFDFGRLFWARNELQFAVEEAERYVMVYTSASDTTVTTYLQGRVTGISTSSITVTITPETISSINYKTVTATYSFQFLFIGLIRPEPVLIKATGRVPVVS